MQAVPCIRSPGRTHQGPKHLEWCRQKPIQYILIFLRIESIPIFVVFLFPEATTKTVTQFLLVWPIPHFICTYIIMWLCPLAHWMESVIPSSLFGCVLRECLCLCADGMETKALSIQTIVLCIGRAGFFYIIYKWQTRELERSRRSENNFFQYTINTHNIRIQRANNSKIVQQKKWIEIIYEPAFYSDREIHTQPKRTHTAPTVPTNASYVRTPHNTILSQFNNVFIDICVRFWIWVDRKTPLPLPDHE